MSDFYVLVDHNQKIIIDHIRKLPENWNNINGLNLLDHKKLSNLDWAGHEGLGWVNINDEILNDYDTLPEWFNISKNGLKKVIADQRWNKEQEIVTYKGNKIKLDERTKLALNLQKTSISGSESEIKWKFIDGFYTLSLSEFNEMYFLIADYIKQCFNEEIRIFEIYDDVITLKDLISKQISVNWPSTTLL